MSLPHGVARLVGFAQQADDQVLKCSCNAVSMVPLSDVLGGSNPHAICPWCDNPVDVPINNLPDWYRDKHGLNGSSSLEFKTCTR